MDCKKHALWVLPKNRKGPGSGYGCGCAVLGSSEKKGRYILSRVLRAAGRPSVGAFSLGKQIDYSCPLKYSGFLRAPCHSINPTRRAFRRAKAFRMPRHTPRIPACQSIPHATPRAARLLKRVLHFLEALFFKGNLLFGRHIGALAGVKNFNIVFDNFYALLYR